MPANAVLLDLFKGYPDLYEPLLQYHEVLLRGPSPLSVGQRELIAAFVSALNACHYCQGVHVATAERFGISPTLLSALLQDATAAPVEGPLKPILLYVRKLTLSPAKMTVEDAEAVYAAGRDERALHDAVAICGLFNLMNRLVDGLGIDTGEEYFRLASERLATAGYAGLTRFLRAQR